jgi:hypothetical protein
MATKKSSGKAGEKKMAGDPKSYELLSIFGLKLRTQNQQLAKVLTKRVIEGYEIALLVAVIAFLLAIAFRVFQITWASFTANSFLKLTNTALLFAIALSLALFPIRSDK